VEKKKFMKGKVTVILSDANRAGEGEHKLIPFLRSLASTKDSICISSPDADLFVLTMGLAKHENIYILRNKDDNGAKNKNSPEEAEYVFVSMSQYIKAFLDKHRLKLTRKRGLDKIARAYKNVSDRYQTTTRQYLVEMRKRDGKVIPLVNPGFLSDLLQEFARMEDFQMKRYYENLMAQSEKVEDPPEEITFETQVADFEHRPYYSNLNPFAVPEVFKTINYMLPKNQWKDQYYGHFFGISPENPREFRDYKKMVCQMYLKSLEYTLQYYLVGVPSWRWDYPFRMAPMPSDILYFLKTVPQDLNFKFSLDTPYTPIEQLVMIQPPQTADIIPRATRQLMTSAKSPIIQFFPIDFELDILAGEKFIYSEPILPDMVDEMVKPVVTASFAKLTETEKKRNTLYDEDQVYEAKGQTPLSKLVTDSSWVEDEDQIPNIPVTPKPRQQRRNNREPGQQRGPRPPRPPRQPNMRPVRGRGGHGGRGGRGGRGGGRGGKSRTPRTPRTQSSSNSSRSSTPQRTQRSHARTGSTEYRRKIREESRRTQRNTRGRRPRRPSTVSDSDDQNRVNRPPRKAPRKRRGSRGKRPLVYRPVGGSKQSKIDQSENQ
jgi:hypothetical protein